jgi:hypothetical protein
MGKTSDFRVFSFRYGLAANGGVAFAVVVQLLDANSSFQEFSFDSKAISDFEECHSRFVSESTTAEEHQARAARYDDMSLAHVSRKVAYAPESLGVVVERTNCVAVDDSVFCEFTSDDLPHRFTFDRELWVMFAATVISISSHMVV